MHLEEFYATQRSAKDLVELRLILKEMVDHTGLEDMAVPALLMTDLIREAAKKDACLADAMTLRGIEIHE